MPRIPANVTGKTACYVREKFLSCFRLKIPLGMSSFSPPPSHLSLYFSSYPCSPSPPLSFSPLFINKIYRAAIMRVVFYSFIYIFPNREYWMVRQAYKYIEDHWEKLCPGRDSPFPRPLYSSLFYPSPLPSPLSPLSLFSLVASN